MPKIFSAEHRTNLSKAMQGNTNASGRILSEKTKNKISSGVAKSWKNAKERKRKHSTLSKGNIWHTRRKWSKEYRAKLSASSKRHSLEDLPNCKCPMHNDSSRLGAARKLSGTKIEKWLINVILAEFPKVVSQAEFLPYSVDAYLPPPYHLAFEADGEYYHRFPKKDSARDAYLLRKYGLPVVRLTELEIQEVCFGKNPDGY